MEETWVQIEKFPNYSISSEGRVRNDIRCTIVKTSTTRQGAVKVGLVSERMQLVRSVKVLVAEAFVDGRTDIFNTPIHLDGNQANNHSNNLVWRPRWFAWKYARQFENPERYIDMGPIVERKSGLVYPTVIDAGLTYGVLFWEIELSLVNKSPVFPNWQMFDWLKEV